MRTKGKSKQSIKAAAKRSTRAVELTPEKGHEMLQRAIDAKDRHQRTVSPPKAQVSDIIERIGRKLFEMDPEAKAEDVVEGIMVALAPDILGESFVAPARSTVAQKVSNILRAMAPEPEPESDSGPDSQLGKIPEYDCDLLKDVPF